MNRQAGKQINYGLAFLTTAIWLFFIAAGLSWMINFTDETRISPSAALRKTVGRK